MHGKIPGCLELGRSINIDSSHTLSEARAKSAKRILGDSVEWSCGPGKSLLPLGHKRELSRPPFSVKLKRRLSVLLIYALLH